MGYCSDISEPLSTSDQSLILRHFLIRFKDEHPIISRGVQKGSRLNCINSFVIINRYGHPHQETLERLQATGAEVYRTDSGGAVILQMQAGKIMLHGYGG